MEENQDGRHGDKERWTKFLPLLLVFGSVLLLTGRYLAFGVPHEFITGEYKGTFEGDYDFTRELVRAFSDWGRLPLWSDTFSGPIGVFASNFHVFAQALLYPLTGSLSLSIKILQVLQLLVAGLGMYTLSGYLFKDRLAGAFTAVLYMFTPFYIGHLLSYLHYTGVYMLAPLIFFLILKTVEARSLRWALLLAPVTVYSLLSHPQNVFIGGIFYFLFFSAVLVRGFLSALADGEARAYVKKMVLVTAAGFTLVFLLSAFTVIPTLAFDYPYQRTSWVGGAGSLVKVDHGHIESHSQSLLATITMQHWPWLQTPLKGGEYPHWAYMAVWSLPFVLSSVALLLRFDLLVAGLLAMAFLSVQIALGVRGEPGLFSLASEYVPFFGMSRTPYSYVNTALVVFCLLPAVTFRWLSRRLAERLGPGRANQARWALIGVFLVPYLLAAHHYGTRYNWTFISASQPAYLGKVWSWMDRNNTGRGRVIETCGIPTAMILNQRMLPNQVDLLERYHRKDYLANYLSLLDFGYVITPSIHSRRRDTFDSKGYTVPSVFDPGEHANEYYSALTTEYYYMYERLRDDPAFRLYTAGTKDVAIFENTVRTEPRRLYQAVPVMVFGGTGSYDLLNVGRFSSRPLPPAPLFVAQKENLHRLGEITSYSDELVLHNTDALDLFMYMNRWRFDTARPEPAGPENAWSLAIHSYGIQQPFPVRDHSIGNSFRGELTFSDYPMKTEAAGSAFRKTFAVEAPGRYAVMLRSYGGESAPGFTVRVDGAPVVTSPGRREPGYGWTTLWEGDLKGGEHTVEASTTAGGEVYVDTVAVVESGVVDPSGVFPAFSGSHVTYVVNHGRFALSEGETTASAALSVSPAAEYTPTVRLARFDETPGEGSVTLLVDGEPVGEVSYGDLGTEPREFTLPGVYFADGRHTLTVSGLTRGVYFDFLTFSTASRQVEAGPVDLDLEKTGPASWSVTAGASEKPVFLAFTETNYPGWTMTLGEERHEPVITNMFTNGFVLPPSETPVAAEIAYENTVHRASAWASLSTLVLIPVLLAAAWMWRGGRRGRGGDG